MFLLLDDIAESNFAYWYRCYCFVVCLSVKFVHCAQTAENVDTMSFAYDSPMSLPAIKFGLHQSTPSFLNFASK